MPTPPPVPDAADVAEWLKALLETDPGGFPVGVGGRPEGSEFPYLVVWPGIGTTRSGPPLGDSQADAAFGFQVDAVGLTWEQSLRLSARAARLVVGRGPDGEYVAAAPWPDGVAVSDRISEGVAGPTPEGDRPNEVWTTSETFVVSVTPA